METTYTNIVAVSVQGSHCDGALYAEGIVVQGIK